MGDSAPLYERSLTTKVVFLDNCWIHCEMFFYEKRRAYFKSYDQRTRERDNNSKLIASAVASQTFLTPRFCFCCRQNDASLLNSEPLLFVSRISYLVL